MTKGNELSKRKEDAKELIRILMKVPDDKKPEIIGIVKGFALCAESEKEKTAGEGR